MLPSKLFLDKETSFWACVRWIGNELGYAKRKEIVVPSIDDIKKCISDISELNGSAEQISMCDEVQKYLKTLALKKDITRHTFRHTFF